ncbi:Flp family type IVb pilin [Aurantiacibacter poecillastricola]|uniref:Flp family type IVb pilin n=1 Tax=Aurantiacibacter poecillastricola TaxID=3064385 RepID=UPI00273E8452|nr:Flp family type IVb pilin [Aurantiacibacter sp. 219JJ12-13]MDP5262219.1 Flp family type IVb pilin [Aurantiacibacter sp. 219JJ12-13]
MKRLLRDTGGATAVEYGLIIALIVIAMVAGMQAFANEVIEMWGLVGDNYEEAARKAANGN